MGTMGRVSDPIAVGNPKETLNLVKVAERTGQAAVGFGSLILHSLASGVMLSVIAGAAIVTDCRLNKWDNYTPEQCYLIGFPIMGIGVAGRSGYEKGYNTYNPALRKKEDREA